MSMTLKSAKVMERKHQVWYIASLGGTQDECARYAGISQGTVTQSYRDDYYSGKLDLAMRIRCAQLKKAFEGDTSLLKHLGKAYCEEQRGAATTVLSKEALQDGIDKLLEDADQKK